MERSELELAHGELMVAFFAHSAGSRYRASISLCASVGGGSPARSVGSPSAGGDGASSRATQREVSRCQNQSSTALGSRVGVVKSYGL